MVRVEGEVAAARELRLVAGTPDVLLAQLVGFAGALVELGGDGERDLDCEWVSVASKSSPMAWSMPVPGMFWQAGVWAVWVERRSQL